MNWESSQLGKQIDAWIYEDLGRGDLTEPAVINKNVKAHWIAKQDGIFCGSELMRRIFESSGIKLRLMLLFNIFASLCFILFYGATLTNVLSACMMYFLL